MNEQEIKKTAVEVIEGYRRSLELWKNEFIIRAEELDAILEKKGEISKRLDTISSILNNGKYEGLLEVSTIKRSVEREKIENRKVEKAIYSKIDKCREEGEERYVSAMKVVSSEIDEKVSSCKAHFLTILDEKEKKIKILEAKITKEANERKNIKIPVVQIRCLQLVALEEPTLLERLKGFVLKKEPKFQKKYHAYKLQYKNAANEWATVPIEETDDPLVYAQR